jgi:hypothetical protein
LQRREKSRPLNIGKKARRAFRALKDAFLRVPILAHFDSTRETKVETDASGEAILGILSQLCPNKDKTE